MRHVPLLGPTESPSRLQIYVPSGYEAPVVGRCNVCGSEFGEGQEQVWQKHVGECARKHMDEILAMRPSERQKGTVWDPENWDPDWERHQLEVGRRMLREGRWERRPSEC